MTMDYNSPMRKTSLLPADNLCNSIGGSGVGVPADALYPAPRQSAWQQRQQKQAHLDNYSIDASAFGAAHDNGCDK